MKDNTKSQFYTASIIIVSIALLITIFLTVRTYLPEKTGGSITNDALKTQLVDLNDIKSSNFPIDLYYDFETNFAESISILEPDCYEESKAKNIKDDGDDIEFSIALCGNSYKVHLGNDQEKYSYAIFHNETKILDYESSNNAVSYLNPDSISRYLPIVRIEEDGLSFIIDRRADSPALLEISVDNCGDQQIKNRALSLAKEALVESGFNPEDFSYLIPNYCDANSES